ncbi:MAG: PRC-barrel domain-containing protein, partial [Candidatus Eisenbacteria bacterium]
AGENIGQVRDLVVDTRGGYLTYAMVSGEDYLGTGADGYLVPFPALSFSWGTHRSGMRPGSAMGTGRSEGLEYGTRHGRDKEALTLDLDRAVLQRAPVFTGRETPNLENQAERERIHDFYMRESRFYSELGEMGVRGMNVYEGAGLPDYYRISELSGWKVVGLREDLGSLNGIAIDIHSGRPVYGIVSHGGFLGMGRQRALVPWTALTVDSDGERLSCNATRDMLPLLAWTDGRSLDDPDLARSIYRAFNEEPYWVSYGYVSPDEQESMRMGSGGTGSGGKATMHGGMEMKQWAGWESGSAYAMLYRPNTVKTVDGEVIAVEEFRPALQSSAGLQIKVRTMNGQGFTVHVGPKWFTAHEGLRVGVGDKVIVSGSVVSISGSDVLIARRVQTGGRTYDLRNEMGVPLWDEAGRPMETWR